MNSIMRCILITVATLSIGLAACKSAPEIAEPESAPSSVQASGELSSMHAIAREFERASLLSSDEFNPAEAIRIANLLHSIGMDSALVVLEKLGSLNAGTERRVWWENDVRYRVLPVMRCLFDRKVGDAPLPEWQVGEIGAPWDRFPASPFERFPIAIVGECPFLITSGYSLAGGRPQSPLEHVIFCKMDCKMREEPLAPTMCPLNAADALCDIVKGEIGGAANYEDVVLKIRRQALRAIQSVYPEGLALAKLWESIPPDAVNEQWMSIKREASSRRIVWSADKQEFATSR